MQGIQEDGYESAEEEFHLTTSGEFCDGASRTRAMPMEELELEELKLWDQEELELSRAQGGAVRCSRRRPSRWRRSCGTFRLRYGTATAPGSGPRRSAGAPPLGHGVDSATEDRNRLGLGRSRLFRLGASCS